MEIMIYSNAFLTTFEFIAQGAIATKALKTHADVAYAYDEKDRHT
jgi:hypothetical protein